MKATEISIHYVEEDTSIQVYAGGPAAIAGYVHDALTGADGARLNVDKIIITRDVEIPGTAKPAGEVQGNQGGD